MLSSFHSTDGNVRNQHHRRDDCVFVYVSYWSSFVIVIVFTIVVFYAVLVMFPGLECKVQCGVLAFLWSYLI